MRASVSLSVCLRAHVWQRKFLAETEASALTVCETEYLALTICETDASASALTVYSSSPIAIPQEMQFVGGMEALLEN